jgi:hypothetical protein
LSRYEWNGGGFPAIRAGRNGFLQYSASSAGAACPARLAMLGIKLKMFILEEGLFAFREDELLPAVDTPQVTISKHHDLASNEISEDQLPEWEGTCVHVSSINRNLDSIRGPGVRARLTAYIYMLLFPFWPNL